MLKHLKPLLPDKWNVWHEPFVGAGGMLLGCCPATARINDSNWMLVNFHRRVAENPNAVWQEAADLGGWNGECTLQCFLDKRSKFNLMLGSEERTIRSAAMLYWIVRHSFNGLYRINSKGQFNAPWNKNSVNKMAMKPLEEFLQCSSVLNGMEICCGDFEAFLEPVQKNDFVFLDPPYVPDEVSGDFVSYTKEGFSEEDHIRTARLARELASKGALVMATNNDTPWTRKLYKGFHFFEYGTLTGIKSGRARREVAMTSYLPKRLDMVDRFC